MIELAIMIEGQDGLNWPRWKRLVRAVEDLGFAGLYRSDHFTNARPPDKDSLELWVSLTWLATMTSRIDFGPLVTPVSFRHPAFTARMAAAVDDLSGGRLWLGVGAGWQEREHEKFGFDLLNLDARFQRFEEGIQVTQRLLESNEPVDFQGAFFQLKDALLLPRPVHTGGPLLLIGGNGKKRTLPLAAHYAQAWNAIYLTAPKFHALNQHLNELLVDQDRSPLDVHRSMMTGIEYAGDEKKLHEKVALRTGGKLDAEGLRERGVIVGTPAQVVDQLGHLAEAGLQRVMLQWLNLDDLDGLESLSARVLTQLDGS
ncbi:MAG: TIGR03560 family F420-dependent LLM class oxidoreductase [Anaerolineales bacterium]|jgi:F420-dependent oxidoreductase-like protein